MIRRICRTTDELKAGLRDTPRTTAQLVSGLHSIGENPRLEAWQYPLLREAIAALAPVPRWRRYLRVFNAVCGPIGAVVLSLVLVAAMGVGYFRLYFGMAPVECAPVVNHADRGGVV